MYILRCRDGHYYTGSTEKDVDARVWEHNNDDELSANYTRKRRPVLIVYAEFHDRIDTAFDREKQVQGWSRAKKEALIDGRWDDLPPLAAGTRIDTKMVREPVDGPPDASTSSATGSGSDGDAHRQEPHASDL
ncbi:GIY-YIG nuclease family protein [Microbacterium pumilum]|uniref:GIY-YIG domain-containing protein n=1 Tax=Microbacterium pumilum TaxID=344165 RepID=A0ABN2T0E7_9MICO